MLGGFPEGKSTTDGTDPPVTTHGLIRKHGSSMGRAWMFFATLIEDLFLPGLDPMTSVWTMRVCFSRTLPSHASLALPRNNSCPMSRRPAQSVDKL